ncbi:MAG: hypothetical protein JO352_37855 [Chloroflexi bacterium]|nr:hypothetical protein [Chloroflexota bacterium]MBV9598155.1 hypothetical protein [Chloroflexota bacterium]
MVASVGERVRFFFGVGGPNLDSAFHIVGLAWEQNAHHDASTPVPAAPQTPVLITEEPLP